MAGRTLEIVGQGGEPAGFVAGDTWHWREGEAAPDALRGFGTSLDTLFRCTEPGARCSLRNLRVTEQLVRCGEPTTLHGAIDGERLRLHGG